MTAKIALIGEAWGQEEAKLQHPFVGVSGVELLRQLDDSGLMPLTPFDKSMLASFWRSRDPSYTKLVWSSHPEIFLTNVFNLRPVNNDIKSLCGTKRDTQSKLPPIMAGRYVRQEYLGELSRLAKELDGFNLGVALGNTATWALLGNSGITKLRGAVATSTLVQGLKILPTFHPAGVLRQWELRHVTVLDLQKAAREAEYPEIRRPKRTVFLEPDLVDLETFYDEHVAGCARLAFDIETAGGQITCIGFSPRRDVALVVPFVDMRRSGHNYWETAEEEVAAWRFVARVLDCPAPKVAQNGLYDVHFLWRGYGITVRNWTDDTMLLHHSLQPESPKGLGFLGSVYTNEASWKLWRDRGNKTTKREDL